MGWFQRILGRPSPASDRTPNEGTSPGHEKARASPYSKQYETIVGLGHEHPTPIVHAPALVWHVGVWPRKDFDPHDKSESNGADPKAARNTPRTYTERRRAWIGRIDSRLAEIQKAGRRLGRPPVALKQFMRPGSAQLPDAGAQVMTLWWKSDPNLPSDPSAIRVKLHCNLTPDFVTFSFYLDIRSLWGGGRSEVSDSQDSWREKIEGALSTIERHCSPANEGVKQGQKAYAQLAPDVLTVAQHREILDARNCLYVDVWEQFIKDMKCSLEEIAGPTGEVFANFRGLALEAREVGELETPETRFPRFSKDPKFNSDGTEANAVIDRYWPFVRRIVPQADYREFVACGLMGWRALYVTALGSPSQYDPDEDGPSSIGVVQEKDIRVDVAPLSAGTTVMADHDSGVQKRDALPGNNHPVRYLVLTKAGPNPRQLGRILERINALGTLRLYALRDWRVIEAADSTLRNLGQDLDRMTRNWSDMRRCVSRLHSIDAVWAARSNPEYSIIEDALRNLKVPGRMRRSIKWVKRLTWRFRSGELAEIRRREEASKLMDIKYTLLSDISSGLETQLIRIGADLDSLGEGAVGGLHFRINRSAIHAAEFRQLLQLLQVGNIQTWTSYDQFVARGLEPAFGYIASVGLRVKALRDRLIAVLETIETSALVGQSSATRHNTGELRSSFAYGLVFLSFVYLVKGSPPWQFMLTSLGYGFRALRTAVGL